MLVGEFMNFFNSKGEKYFKNIIKLESKGCIDSDKNKQKWFNEECKTEQSQYIRTTFE